ncbi:MAG: sodium:solute symporter [Thermoguttaceae bacterium]|jgi:SSS family solute:Na+ symporter
MPQGFGIWDWAALFAYFAVLLGVAWWVVLQKNKSSRDYFLAGKNAGWFVIGASLFASNIGLEHLVGLAGTGASDGMAMAHYELHAWCLLVLGWLMVPFYVASGVYTMPEFLERRYCAAARWFLSLFSLVAYIFTKISVTLFAGGIVFKALFPDPIIGGLDNFWFGACFMVVLTGLYTIAGGLRAVLYTEVIQTVVLLLGAACVLVFGLREVGGWSRLRELCQDAPRMAVVAPEEVDGVDVAAEPQLVPTDEELDFFNLWKPNSDPSYPWFGLLFGAPIVGLWYWCTDQYIVQRTLAAKNQTEARRGTIFGAYLKMFPVFLFIIPGMAAYGIAAQGDVRLFPVLEEGGANQAFPLLVKHILPVGVKGVVIGGLLAALMSSLASVFNSCSTLFTIDIYKKIVPSATEKHLVWIGRLATTAMVILGLLWIPVVILLMKGSLYDYLQAVQSYIGPPIAAVFFLGIFCKRVNAAGCMAGLGVGFLLGASRLIAEILSKGTGAAAETIASSPFLNWFATTSFTFMAIWLTVASVAVILAVSLVTPKPPKEKTDRLTWSTRTAEDRAETRASWNRWDLIASVGLILCILTIYIYFTGNMLR